MSEARRREWVGALVRERERREQLRWVRPTDPDECEQWYFEKICQFLARMFAQPGWYPGPDCPEVRMLKEAGEWMVGRGETLLDPHEFGDADLEQAKIALREMGYLVDGHH